MSSKDNKMPQIYYEYDDKRINFTLFDLEMRIFEFSSDSVSREKLDQTYVKTWNKLVARLYDERSMNEKAYDEYGEM